MSKQSQPQFEQTNIPGLVQDKKTKVILNRNYGDYERVLAARKKKFSDDQLKRDVMAIKKELVELRNEIKFLKDQNG